ncbi:MAG: hypothetical protein AAGB12_15355 [Pseudomonadota bacterium]
MFIVAKAKDYTEVKVITEEDPFVINNVVDYRITEFDPIKQQDWFNTLSNIELLYKSSIASLTPSFSLNL